jgi:hypothetical protein
MTTLIIDIKDLMFGVSAFNVPDYQNQVTIDYDHGTTTVAISGLDDWSDWQSKFISQVELIIGNNVNQITFEIV